MALEVAASVAFPRSAVPQASGELPEGDSLRF